MGAPVGGGESRHSSWLHVTAGEQDDSPALAGCSAEQVRTRADVARSIAVMETAGRVESDLAETLRALAAQDRGEAAARRLSLAEDAVRGAQAAAETAECLRQQARRRAEHDDVVALRQALEQAATVLGDLARAANRIARVLADLAGRNGSELEPRQQELATAASAAAQHARDLAQTLHRLADTDQAETQVHGTPVADPVAVRTLRKSSASQRIADIDRRLGELGVARPADSGDSPVPTAGPDARRRAEEASRHWQEAVAHLLQARQLTAEAFCRAARAHERAAEANARSARAGIGDVAEHNRMAEFHRAAANADWQQARNIDEHVARPGDGPDTKRTDQADVSA